MKTLQVTRRPADVLNALRLLTISLLIELLAFAFSGDYSVGSIIGVLVGAALVFWILRQVHAGANWARFVMVGLLTIGTLMAVTSFRAEYALHPGTTVINAFSTVISIIAGVLLFTKSSNQWFNRHSRPLS